MIQIIVVNGFPESGKTTFENYCLKKLAPYGTMCSTVDFVKEIAVKCGWDGTKTPENRKFLSDLKDLLTRWNDVPFHKIEDHARRFYNELAVFGLVDKPIYVFVDCREPAEIQRFVDEMGAITVLVRRPENEHDEQSNHADKNVLDFRYDFTIMNDSTIDVLYDRTDDFLRILNEEISM